MTWRKRGLVALLAGAAFLVALVAVAVVGLSRMLDDLRYDRLQRRDNW